MAKVLNLFRAPKRRLAMEELIEARVVENAGLDGCAHARPGGRRQVLLMDIETLRAVDLAPGMVRENITTEGLEVNALKAGQKLRVGEVELEVSLVCEPCEQLEQLRAGLKDQMVGGRGMLCRVLRGGTVKQGDPIAVQGYLKGSVCGGVSARPAGGSYPRHVVACPQAHREGRSIRSRHSRRVVPR